MLWAVTTALGNDLALLPHWIKHYGGMGAKMVVMLACGGAVPDTVDLHDADVTYASMPESIAMGKWQHYPQLEKLCAMGIKDDDWLIVADLDEMMEFPRRIAPVTPVQAAIDACERRKLPCVYGHFVDMVAADGSLPPVLADKPLAEQFPVETRLTEMVLGGGTQKVMLMRPNVTIYEGHHYAAEKIGGPRLYPDIPFGELGQYKVRHYKWKSNLREHILHCMSFANCAESWRKEMQTALNYLDSHGGKIDFNDPPGLLDMEHRFYGNPT
jgi:hypothetical protein